MILSVLALPSFMVIAFRKNETKISDKVLSFLWYKELKDTLALNDASKMIVKPGRCPF